MAQRNPTNPAAIYVVHPLRVVAEDVRESLIALGLADVRIAARLRDVPTAGIALALIAAAESELTAQPHLHVWARAATPVILFDACAKTFGYSATFAHLSQPFDPEDLLLALRRLAMI